MRLRNIPGADEVIRNCDWVIKEPADKKGKWNTVTFTISVPDDKFYYALYFESYNGNGNDDIYLDNITLTKTLQTNPDKTIASLKDTYKDSRLSALEQELLRFLVRMVPSLFLSSTMPLHRVTK